MRINYKGIFAPSTQTDMYIPLGFKSGDIKIIKLGCKKVF
jgi:hypothetical protein